MQGGDLELGASGPGLTSLQASERIYLELQKEYLSLHAAALSLERKEQLTTKYQPIIDKGALS